MDDAFTSSLIDSVSIYAPSNWQRWFNFVFKPNLDFWGAGLYTESTTVKINISMWFSKGSDSSVRVNSYANTSFEFDLSILPLAALVQQMRSDITNTLFKSGGASSQTYTYKSAAITITPPSFWIPSIPAYYSNTNFPTNKLSLYTKLEYSLNGGVTYYQFPEYPAAGTFVSLKADTTCFPTIDTSTWGFTVYCGTDPSKF
jgi:hypothetical protein